MEISSFCLGEVLNATNSLKSQRGIDELLHNKENRKFKIITSIWMKNNEGINYGRK